MGELIERDEALRVIGEYDYSGFALWQVKKITDGCKAAVAALPIVDAVPVVRCKDCKYWQDNNGGYPHGECKWSCEETPDSDDFCSWGERKEEEE